MDVRILMDWSALQNRLGDGLSMGQVVLDEQALKDSNRYAPEDVGDLIQSGIRNTDFGSGSLKWDTEYARKLYYNPQYQFSKDKNPMAGGLWFERAKAAKLPIWIRITNDAFRQNF